MKHYKVYYLPYVKDADVNYLFLFYLYGLAEESGNNIRSMVVYKSVPKLAEKINETYKQANSKNSLISKDTVGRILANSAYKPFFECETDGKDKLIILNNNFKSAKEKPFVRITPNIYNLLIEKQDKLLAKYVVYLIYCCGITDNKSDFTANQFFTAIGYSTKSNNYKSKLSEYNKLLVDNHIISIKQWRDDDKQLRNTYSLLDEDYKPRNKTVLN